MIIFEDMPLADILFHNKNIFDIINIYKHIKIWCYHRISLLKYNCFNILVVFNKERK